LKLLGIPDLGGTKLSLCGSAIASELGLRHSGRPTWPRFGPEVAVCRESPSSPARARRRSAARRESASGSPAWSITARDRALEHDARWLVRRRARRGRVSASLGLPCVDHNDVNTAASTSRRGAAGGSCCTSRV